MMILRLFISILSIFILSNSAIAAVPVLFYSDLNSGPKIGWNGSATKGAAVTVWGRNFGAVDGANSYLTVCGQQINSNDANIVTWNGAGIARGDKYIEFFLNSSMTDGVGTIQVTTTEGSSNTISFTIRAGNIYFVDDAVNSSDLNDGTYDTYQSGTTGPWRNISKCRTAAAAGDICYVRNGSYTTVDAGGALVYFSSGDFGGTPGNPKAWIGYPGESVTLGDGALDIFLYQGDSDAASGYMTIAKFIMAPFFNVFTQGLNCPVEGSRDYIRLVGLNINSQGTDTVPQNGNVYFAGSSHNKVYGCYFENLDNCVDTCYSHNVYLSNLVAGCGDIYGGSQYDITDIEYAFNEHAGGVQENRNLGSALKIHARDDNTYSRLDEIYVHSNYFHDLNKESIDLGAYALDIYVYNNIFANNSLDTSLVYGGVYQFSYPATAAANVRTFNNTVYVNNANADPALFYRESLGSTDTHVNNIYMEEVAGSMTFGTDSNWFGTRSGDENLVYGYSAPAWYTNTDTADPLFTDAANGDFTLSVGSPAIEAGLYSVDTIAALNTATMYSEPRDYLGQIRGNSFDQGAIEYAYDGAADTTPPAVEISTQAQTTQCDSVSIAWIDGDNVGVTTRKWRIGSVPDATYGTEATSPATVTGMSIGSNEVYIGAGDAAANWGNDSITISYTGICQKETITGGYKITGADGQFSKTGASIISR